MMPHPKTHQDPSRKALLTLSLALPALVLAGCHSDDDDDDDDDMALLMEEVDATAGGTFTVPGLTVTIPPGALSGDATLTIDMADDAPDVDEDNLEAAGDAYEITVTGATLDEPLMLAFDTDTAPTRPQLREIARLEGDEWQRLPANFYRASDGVVLGMTERTSLFRPVNRTLQTASGDGVARGEELFLYETFGNEAFFGDVLGLHTLLNNLAPGDAVGVGVQIDLARVPEEIVAVLTGDDFEAKQAALGNPAVTRALVAAGAIVGVYGEADDDGMLTTAGITCALCHVTVEPTEFQVAAGTTVPLPVGALRLDGVPNLDMDAGTIIALTPFIQEAGEETVNVLTSWGAGNFDVRALPDNPLDDGVVNPTNVPPLWNFIDLAEQGYAFNWDGLFKSLEDPDNALASQAEVVYDLIMHANGAFGTDMGTIPPQLSITPPQALLDALAQAEADAPGNVITEQALLDVQDWQRSIASPAPGEFDEEMAQAGFELFYGKAGCDGCHQTAEFTGPGLFNILGKDLEGGLAGGIKVAGLRGVSHAPPYFHDGSVETLEGVIDVYVEQGIAPELTEDERVELAEYLRSL